MRIPSGCARSRARHGRVQVRQFLHHDVLPLLERDGIVLLAVFLKRALAHFHCLALLGQTQPEPVGGVLRGGELELEVLLDVGARQPVGDLGGDFGVRRRVGDLDEAAVANRRDGEIRQKAVDNRRLHGRLVGGPWLNRFKRPEQIQVGPGLGDRAANGEFHRLFRRIERVPQLQPIQRPAGQRPALQDAVLRLVIVVRRLFLLENFLERDDVRVLRLDQELNTRLEDGCRGERIHEHRHDHEQKRRERRPAPAIHDLHVVAQMNLIGLSVASRVLHGRMARVAAGRKRIAGWIELKLV
jgi:hypothetical protein